MFGKKWKILAAAGVLAAAVALTGCGGSSGSGSSAAADGIIRVGAETTYPDRKSVV